ncbi:MULTISPECIES: GntR family transcriptional regulator [unclassified Blautia]|uniref:GntR family transcriptional regulator n=1 Tax=unclassified Blautia TaxID=2648079 RepID=UPI000B3A4806|nr:MULTISPECIES: GntR family transcriptional regulator [unclassified Blautia]OUN31356.1 GntR family transcriptional regulator [Blautia sp. An81]OUN92361.1 GntR family transcriptional regulator [Blautia sp. An46]
MIVIDYQNRKPIYEQIVERFQMLIVKGILEADSQMPSVRTLASELSINPNTIQKAYTILEQQGYIYPVKGRGNFVSGNQTLKEKKEEVFFQKLRDVIQEGKELGIEKERCIAKTSEFYEEDKV